MTAYRKIRTVSSLTPLSRYQDTYDAMNRITSINSSQDGVSTFNYDQRSQLLAADHAPQRPDENYSYDNNGNRNMAGYTTGSNNQTTADGTYTYLYDNEGNRTRRTKISDGSYEAYTWDHRNRLTKVTFYSVSIGFMGEGGSGSGAIFGVETAAHDQTHEGRNLGLTFSAHQGSGAIFGVETAAYDQTHDGRKLGVTFSAHQGSGAIFGFETVAHDQTGEGRNLGLVSSERRFR